MQQKDLLIREVNHRVKNSLQLVTSLLNIHRRNSQSADAREHFDTAIARVLAISSVHERLYKTDRIEVVEFGEYLRSLCTDLMGAAGRERSDCTVAAATVGLRAEIALPLGLIANELVTNVLKHAYPAGGACPVHVELSQGDDNVTKLVVADKGAGIADDSPPRSGLGTRLVQTLVQQLEGELTTEQLNPGLRITVTLPRAR